MSFADVVKGQEKYNVARSFSALLQLVVPHLAKFYNLPFLFQGIASR